MYLFQLVVEAPSTAGIMYLHSTMYLFQRKQLQSPTHPTGNLHSTMYLFQRCRNRGYNSEDNQFTFHYVSISTITPMVALVRPLHLHSTMYLFQPWKGKI